MQCLSDFAGDVISRPDAPRVAGQGLRPQTERAERGTSARRIERDIRMEQKRNVVVLDGEIAFVDLCGERQSVEFPGLEKRSRRVVDDPPPSR